MPVKKVVIKPAPVPYISPVNDIERFTSTYGAPQELMDSPEAWDSEYFYFGMTDAVTPPAPSAAPVVPATTVPWYQRMLETAIPAVLQYKQMREFQKLNIERAKQGLPPISTDQYRAMTPPAAAVEIGMSPQTRNLIIFGGLALGTLILMGMKGRKA